MLEGDNTFFLQCPSLAMAGGDALSGTGTDCRSREPKKSLKMPKE